MRQAGQRQRFTPEPLETRLVTELAERAAQEHLDGDRAIEPGIVRLPDFAHSTGADALDELVSPE
jgi:hypothetical protein